MKLLGVHEGERRDAWAAFALLFGLIGSHAVLETARDALFLAAVPATRLPWVFIATAAASLAAVKLHARLGNDLDEARVVQRGLLAAGGLTLAFFWLAGGLGSAGLYALYVWSGVVTTLLLAHLWTLLASLFSVTQAKRLYGFIGAGGALGAIAGSAVAAALSRVAAVEWLLCVSALGFCLTAAAPSLLRTTARTDRGTDSDAALAKGLGYVAQRPYAARVVLLALLSAACLTFVDFSFKALVAARVPRSELGAFLGTVYFGLNVASLVVQLLVVRRLLDRFSVVAALVVLPALLAAGGMAVALTGGLAAVVFLKGADGALRYSVHRTAAELLFLPFSERARRRLKPLVEVVGQRGGQIVASLAILALATFGVGVATLAAVLVALALAWVAAVVALRSPYVEMYRRRLQAGRLAHLDEFPEMDVASLETLVASLDSSKDGEVLAALTVLERERKTHLIPGLIVFHPSDGVVERALAVFAAAGRTNAVPLIDRVLDHASPRVRAAAVAARAVLSSDAQPLRVRLETETAAPVRAALTVNLAVTAANPDATATSLDALVQSADTTTQVALATAIAHRRATHLGPALIVLADAGQREVRLAAVEAMGLLQDPSFLPALIARLGEEATRPAAQRALLAYGEDGFTALLRTLREGGSGRARIPEAISRFDAEPAANGLLAWLPDEPEGGVRYQILLALERIARRNPRMAFDRARLGAVVDQTLSRAYRHLDCRIVLDLGADEVPARRTAGHELLRRLLNDKMRHAIERLFRLLGLLQPEDDFARIHRGLGGSKNVRATSLELVSNVLREPLRSAVLALVEDLPDAERMTRAGKYHRPLGLDYVGLLDELLESDSAAVQDIAVYHIGELGLVSFSERVARLPNPEGTRADLSRTLTLLGRRADAMVTA